jgi:hypothetical protein
MQHYMALRLDEQDSAMQDIVREVHLIQEKLRHKFMAHTLFLGVEAI